MTIEERAIDLIRSFNDAKIDGFESIRCARIFVEKMKSFCGENTYYKTIDEKRFGIKLNAAYWALVSKKIDYIEKRAIIQAADNKTKK